jgi:hypothetical protein
MSGKVPEINLVFDEPVQRKKAPKHLADFAPADRKAFAKELGFEPFRANQVANHYFSHLSDNPEEWTDIPAAERQAIADALIPKMTQLVTTRTTDNGMTRKDLWKLHDGVLVESVLNLELLKAHNAESYLQRRWEMSNLAGADSYKRIRSLTNWIMGLTTSIQQVITVAMVVGGVYLIHANQLTLGGLIASVILAGRLRPRVADCGRGSQRCRAPLSVR